MTILETNFLWGAGALFLSNVLWMWNYYDMRKSRLYWKREAELARQTIKELNQ